MDGLFTNYILHKCSYLLFPGCVYLNRGVLPVCFCLSTSSSVTFFFSPRARLHSVTHTHAHTNTRTPFIPIFTSVSAGPSAINCVPDWDLRERVWLGVLGVCTRGRQARLGTALSRGGSHSLISLPTSIPRMIAQIHRRVSTLPEDVSH